MLLHTRSSTLARSLTRSLTGLLLTGKYNAENKLQLSAAAEKFNQLVDDRLSVLAGVSKIKNCRTFYGLHKDYPVVSLTVIKNLTRDAESRDNKSESVRSAIGTGITNLVSDSGITEIIVDSAGNAKVSSEAAALATYKFDSLKSVQKTAPKITQCRLVNLPNKCKSEWIEGNTLGRSQNTARYLMEMPANHMTPRLFIDAIQKEANSIDGLELVVRDKDWMSEQKMGAFLSVSRGSVEPPYLLEMHYRGCDMDPVCLVGKGVTFDSGGISIKPSKGMDAMKGDMGGAACVAAATLGAAAMKLPVHITTLIPLCENMPSGGATKPGDVVTAMNGTTIQVDNTDAEGRLILADALTYADSFNPGHVIDVATLTGAIAIALGGEVVGVYCNSEALWETLQHGGYVSGDRLWRMPLYKEYADLLKSKTADVNNISSAPYGGSITAAVFLQKFTKSESWAHLDIAGVMDNTDSMSYLPKGMSGRPTRTVIEALKLLAVQ